MRNKCVLLLLVLSLQFMQQDCYGQKKDGVKKIRILPVYLFYTGLPADTATDRIVKEAFSRHKVELINRAKFDDLNRGEIQRVETKFRVRDDKFRSESEITTAISNEQRFVSNMLFITFDYKSAGDSLVSATWKNTPSPENIISGRSSGYIDTKSSKPFSSLQESIFDIIDQILASKWMR